MIIGIAVITGQLSRRGCCLAVGRFDGVRSAIAPAAAHGLAIQLTGGRDQARLLAELHEVVPIG